MKMQAAIEEGMATVLVPSLLLPTAMIKKDILKHIDVEMFNVSLSK